MQAELEAARVAGEAQAAAERGRSVVAETGRAADRARTDDLREHLDELQSEREASTAQRQRLQAAVRQAEAERDRLRQEKAEAEAANAPGQALRQAEAERRMDADTAKQTENQDRRLAQNTQTASDALRPGGDETARRAAGLLARLRRAWRGE